MTDPRLTNGNARLEALIDENAQQEPAAQKKIYNAGEIRQKAWELRVAIAKANHIDLETHAELAFVAFELDRLNVPAIDPGPYGQSTDYIVKAGDILSGRKA